MQNLNRFLHLMLFVFLSTLVSCQKEDLLQLSSNSETFPVSEIVFIPDLIHSASDSTNRSNTFFGPQVQMGNGHTRSWTNISRGNIPIAIGIEFTEGALENLPTTPAECRFDLKLHQKGIATTPFDHITINWNPEGHRPEGIYNVPHFDMHFYKIPIAVQNNITEFPTAAPPAGYLPESYVIQGATEPQMGTHWLDPAFPEFPPTAEPFTYTFIYGSNNGEVTFLEPMITKAFFQGGGSVSIPYPQPINFSPAGKYYPTMYRIWKDDANGRSYVALTDFEWR